jgi:uncharacterized membrane protein YjdF
MPKSNGLPELNGPASPSLKEQNGQEIKPTVFFNPSRPENDDTEKTKGYAVVETLFPLETRDIPVTQEFVRIFSWDYANKVLFNISRALLGGLFLFDFLHAVGLMHHAINFTWVGLTFTSASVWFLLELILYYTKKNQNQLIFGFLMFAVVAGLYLDTIGDMHFLFDKILWYDQVLHFFAGGMTCGGIFFWVIKNLEDRGKIKMRLMGIGFFAWITAVFFGVLYELAEYSEDVFTGSHRLGDAFDTANDLMLDTLGAFFIIVILVVYFYYVSRRSHAADQNPAPESANT